MIPLSLHVKTTILPHFKVWDHRQQNRVIPAKAGIHMVKLSLGINMDPRLRGDDAGF